MKQKMPKHKTYLSVIGIVAFIGVLFSGSLTYYTYTSGKAGCELFFFGMPSCFYGMLMYLLIAILSAGMLLKLNKHKKLAGSILILSIAGIIFAAYLTERALSNLSCAPLKIFGVVPCVYGLIMYFVVLALALISRYNRS